jgi:hypothetical protein
MDMMKAERTAERSWTAIPSCSPSPISSFAISWTVCAVPPDLDALMLSIVAIDCFNVISTYVARKRQVISEAAVLYATMYIYPAYTLRHYLVQEYRRSSTYNLTAAFPINK